MQSDTESQISRQGGKVTINREVSIRHQWRGDACASWEVSRRGRWECEMCGGSRVHRKLHRLWGLVTQSLMHDAVTRCL